MKATSEFRRGFALLYVSAVMMVFIGFVALAVDYARVRLDKSRLQSAADSAALYAANGLIGGSQTSVQNRAVTAAADNKIETTSVVVDPTQDVNFGIWDPATATFTQLPGTSIAAATAVQVTAHRSASRGTAIPLLFSHVLGFASKDLSATAIASIGTITSASVPAQDAPWLAGMPNGSTIPATNHNPTPAVAPDNSPVLFPATGGATFRFTSTTGSTSWNSAGGTVGTGTADPDGDDTAIIAQDAVNGINTTNAPLQAMMGIFLDNTQPDSSAMAASLNFSTTTSRDFTSFSPQLKQVFFIGDGLNSSGQLQSFIAPAGAKRLYLGTMDNKGWWWDNVGSIQFQAVEGNTPVLVR